MMKKIYILTILLGHLFFLCMNKVSAFDFTQLTDVGFHYAGGGVTKEYNCYFPVQSNERNYECNFSTHINDYNGYSNANHDYVIINITTRGFIYTNSSEYVGPRTDGVNTSYVSTGLDNVQIVNFSKPNIRLITTDNVTYPCDYDGNNAICFFPRGKVLDYISYNYKPIIPQNNNFVSGGRFYYTYRVNSNWVVANSVNDKIVENIQNGNENVEGAVNDFKSQAHSDSQAEINATNRNTQAVNNVNNSINSTSTSGSESFLNDIVNDPAFQDTTGINSIITLPLNMISSLSNSCQPITLNIPFLNVDVQIPCFRSVITNHMPLVANLISVVVNGFILYRIFIDIVGIIKSSRNPDEDRLDVLEL